MEFNFKTERKVTVWEREYFTIEAGSEEEAKQKLLSLKEELYDSGEVNMYDSETIYETSEDLPVEENFGSSTFGIKFQDEVIYENGEEGTF